MSEQPTSPGMGTATPQEKLSLPDIRKQLDFVMWLMVGVIVVLFACFIQLLSDSYSHRESVYLELLYQISRGACSR